MVPYIPVPAKIFHMLPDLVENLRSLIANQYAEADRAICGRGNFILRLSHQKHRLSVADWKALSKPQRQRVQHAVFSLACEGVAGTQQSTSTDGSLTVLHRPDAGKKLGILLYNCFKMPPKRSCLVVGPSSLWHSIYHVLLSLIVRH